jgi:hypothetical protein
MQSGSRAERVSRHEAVAKDFILRAMMPAILIVGTIHFQLKSRVTHRFDRS